MPQRPSRITGEHDLLHVVNQNMREMQGRIDDINRNLRPVPHIRNSSIAPNFGTIPANGSVDRTVSLLGTSSTAVVHASPQLDIGSGLTWSTRASSKDQITFRIANATTSPITPPVVKWSVFVTL